MKDLTKGSIPRHIVALALPIAVGMLLQTLYYLVDLYFVGQLGSNAIAGVSAAGNATFLIVALTQILGVGTVALISQAVGKKDKTSANSTFNQSLLIALIMLVVTLLLGYSLARPYLQMIVGDPEAVEQGVSYLYWFIPSLAMQFLLVAMGSALRGTGIVKPTMLVQLLSVLINIILAPILIAGWFTGYPMGVAGAGLASSIAVLVAVVLMAWYFYRLERYVSIDFKQMALNSALVKKILAIGFPAGGEFILMFLYMGVIYWCSQGFGAEAQAGFGLGSRMMQAIFLPALALAFAMPAVVGQNFGAGQSARVREAFKATGKMIILLMAVLGLFSWFGAEMLLAPFSDNPQVIATGATFLHFIAFNFIPSGLIFTCSGLLQGLGNTWPAFYSMSSRLFLFALPSVYLSQQPGFELESLWVLSVATVAIQMVISLLLAQRELNKKLNGLMPLTESPGVESIDGKSGKVSGHKILVQES